MTSPSDLEVGDIVQLDPQNCRNKAFCGCLMTVTEVKEWGAQGYVQALGTSFSEPGGQAYYRAKWEEMSPRLGQTWWIVE